MAVGLGVDVTGVPLGDTPKVTQRLVGTSKVRKILEVTGYTRPNTLFVHNASLTNLVKGISERVLSRKVNGVWVSTQVDCNLGNTFKWYTDRLVSVVGICLPLTKDQFLRNYSGAKKARYIRAFDSLIEILKKEDSECKVFVKADKVTHNKTPRIISPRSDRYHVSLGVYIGAVEHSIFRAVDKIAGHRVVLKGANGLERAGVIESYMSKPNRVAIGVDASRFDASVCPSWLELEHSVYNKIFNDPGLKMLLQWQIKYSCKGKTQEGGVKYEMNGGRASGDMNTSLGNIIIMCALIIVYMDTLGIEWNFINDGDDAVIFVEEKHVKLVQQFPSWCVQWNFHMVMEKPVSTLEHVEFCQSKPVWNGENYIMVRNFPLSMFKDQVCVKYRDPVNARDWLYSISMCGKNLSAGVPINYTFYESLSTGGKFIKDNAIKGGLYYLQKGIKQKYRRVTATSRYSFWLAFGVTPDEQTTLERQLQNYAPPEMHINNNYNGCYSGEWKLDL